MHTHTYIYIYIYIHTHIDIDIYIYTYINIYIYIHTYIHAYTHTHIYIYIYVGVYAYMHTSIFITCFGELPGLGTEFEAQAAAPEEKRQRVSFSSVVLKVEDPAGPSVEHRWGVVAPWKMCRICCSLAVFTCFYPLVMTNIAMENHYFQWKNPL